MNANDIRIGTKLEIEITDYTKNNSDSNSSSYISQLLDVIDSKTISVAAPMGEGRLKFLSRDLKIFIYYLNEKQDLLYFKATVKEHKKNGPLDAFDIIIDSEISKIQRRRYYRLDVALSCQYIICNQQLPSLLNESDFQKINEEDLKTAYTKNISGSGFCLILEDSLESGTILDVTINLDDTAFVRVFAQVIRSINVQGKKYEVGTHYINISSRDSSFLTKYIFEKQRLILKNTMQAKNN